MPYSTPKEFTCSKCFRVLNEIYRQIDHIHDEEDVCNECFADDFFIEKAYWVSMAYHLRGAAWRMGNV
jgi:hypothetical protein